MTFTALMTAIVTVSTISGYNMRSWVEQLVSGLCSDAEVMRQSRNVCYATNLRHDEMHVDLFGDTVLHHKELLQVRVYGIVYQFLGIWITEAILKGCA